MNLNIHAKIIIGYLSILLCLVLSLLTVINRMTDLQQEIDYVANHDIEIHDLANQIQKNMLDMETGMRGFAITGNDQYLDPYNQASRSWLDNYNNLHSLLEDNRSQQRNLEEMKPLIVNWITNSGEYVINAKKENNTRLINQHFAENRGKNLTDQLRTQLQSFLATEKKLTNERINKLNEHTNNLKLILYGIIILVSVFTIAISVILSNTIVRTIKKVVRAINGIMDENSEIDLTSRIEVNTGDETQELAEAMNGLLDGLEKRNWVQKSLTDISTLYQGITDINELTQMFINKLAPLVGAAYGVVYLRREQAGEVDFVKIAGYAVAEGDLVKTNFRLGEGIIGQAAVDKRIFLIDQIPDNHFKITTGLGTSNPRNLLIAPILFDDRVEAVVEFAALQPFQAQHLTLLELIQDKFGSSISTVTGRMEVERLLAESQVMTEELQAQSEELQAQSEELQMQQEQLRLSNDYLEEQREYAEEQKEYAEQRALELKKAKDELEDYSIKLKMSSQYKTDFLANMSHELRTPLNSILILSQMLMENNSDMDHTEVAEYARVVNTSGGDLLRLIDDILDLSKIEAGKIEILTDEVNITEIPQMMRNLFNPVAANKNLQFDINMDPNIPPVISTDGQRLQQILKNLLSNAFKFTEQGSVTLQIGLAPSEKAGKLLNKQTHEPVLAISVTDTGIGIPQEKQQIIFDAFQQVDGTTNRQYGGTGLGLSICREFTRLLGGTLEVHSEPQKGSTFTLFIPSRWEAEEYVPNDVQLAIEEAATASEIELTEEPTWGSEEPQAALIEKECPDEQLFKGKRVLLVEDDGRNVFALVTALERKGVNVQVAEHGKQALEMLQERGRYDLVFMDIMMPVMDGYEAMKIIREDLGMHNLPIIALTAKAMKGERDKCMEAGASDYITKPLNIDQLFSLMRVWLTEQVNQD